jgi:ubiquinone/menaquinone biosynthesis C-methylase UbiE
MGKYEVDFTGERVVPGKTPPDIYREHTDRYAFAAGLTRGRAVLDVACGTGYGVDCLVEGGAASALGVDVSMEAVDYARERFGADGRASFVCADGIRLPFVDGCFDAVVSFETIEHIGECGQFLDECRRVLKEAGLLICSTPNKRIFSPDVASPPNTFHVREFWPEEFRQLLGRGFEDVEFYGQCDVTLADNSVERDRGVHEFVDSESMSSGYVVAVARKKSGVRS